MLQHIPINWKDQFHQKQHVRRLLTIIPDKIERKKYKSAQELGFKQQERHFHRCLPLDFLNRDAIVYRHVLKQMANIDMTSINLKSIKSPKRNFCQAPSAIPIEDIYFQLPHMTMYDDIYDEDDSFVDDTTEIIDKHHGEVDLNELTNILATQSVIHRQSKVTRRGIKFGRTLEKKTLQRKPPRRVQIAQSPI